MMLGHLRSRNVFVQRERVRSSLVRTDPVGRSLRWFNTIGRHAYSVRGPNFLWHIDELHCLVRWRFVIHRGNDGFSRLIVYLNCSTNNLAAKVHALFVAAEKRSCQTFSDFTTCLCSCDAVICALKVLL